MNNTYEKRGYLLDDFRLFHLKDVQGTNVDYHYHEFPKVIFMWSGAGNYSIDGNKYMIQDLDILLIGKQKIHRPEFEKGSLYERSIIYISPDFLKHYSTKECDLEAIFDNKNGHVIRTKDNRNVFELVNQFEQELSVNRYGKDVMSNVILIKILIEIGRITAEQRKAYSNVITTQNTRIIEIMKYIDQHLVEEISIEQLAERFYLSKYHMMRLFRQETGQSIYEYLTLRRLLKARDLIIQGENATESCYNSGFRSYSSFTRAYTKYFGSTPTGRKSQSAQREETYE